MKLALRIAHVGLSFGLVLLIERMKVSRRWLWLLWALIIANEVRGAWVVWNVGGAAFDMVL